MECFTAHNKHTEKSIQRLSKAQYNLFGTLKQIRILITGIACLLVAVFINIGGIYQVFLMLIGGWLVVSSQLPEKRQTEKLLLSMNGHFPESAFTFDDYAFFVKINGADEVLSYPYEKIVCIAKDNEYYYLFISPFSGFMFPFSSLVPNEPSKFEEFLLKKTNLIFLSPCSLFKLSLKEIQKRIKSAKTLRKRKKQIV